MRFMYVEKLQNIGISGTFKYVLVQFPNAFLRGLYT